MSIRTWWRSARPNYHSEGLALISTDPGVGGRSGVLPVGLYQIVGGKRWSLSVVVNTHPKVVDPNRAVRIEVRKEQGDE